MRKYIVATTLILGALLTGCVSLVPTASLEEDQKAKSFVVDAKKSNIYLYRNEFIIGSAVAIPVLLDGMVVGKTGP